MSSRQTTEDLWDDDPFTADLAPVTLQIRQKYLREPAPEVANAHLEAMFAVAAGATPLRFSDSQPVKRRSKAILATGIVGATMVGTMGLAAAGVLPDTVQRGVAGIVRPFGVNLHDPGAPAGAGSGTSGSGSTGSGSSGSGSGGAPGASGEPATSPGGAPTVGATPDDPTDPAPSTETQSAGNGQSDNAPGHGGVDPGNSATAPGHDGGAPGNDNPGPVASTPQNTPSSVPHTQPDKPVKTTTTPAPTTTKAPKTK